MQDGGRFFLSCFVKILNPVSWFRHEMYVHFHEIRLRRGYKCHNQVDNQQRSFSWARGLWTRSWKHPRNSCGGRKIYLDTPLSKNTGVHSLPSEWANGWSKRSLFTNSARARDIIKPQFKLAVDYWIRQFRQSETKIKVSRMCQRYFDCLCLYRSIWNALYVTSSYSTKISSS
jgi:hypothetical protein